MKSAEIILTDDGSHSLISNKFGEQYHSSFGAIQESEHIFISGGLKYIGDTDNINILEIGTGTGLNVLLTFIQKINSNTPIDYDGIEQFPPNEKTIKQLNYPDILEIDRSVFEQIHSAQNEAVNLSDSFRFRNFLENVHSVELPENRYNLIYMDAFSPDIQPEMWSVKLFEKLFRSMKRGGVLTTYSCKGVVKRALKSAGFTIEKLPGPPGKREFLRATKV